MPLQCNSDINSLELLQTSQANGTGFEIALASDTSHKLGSPRFSPFRPTGYQVQEFPPYAQVQSFSGTAHRN